LLFRKSHKKDRIIQSSTGKFYCRKQTNDFQFANFRYEWGVKKFMLDRLSDFNVFVDGGACTGEYCVWLSQQNIRCIAFEPVQKNYEVILKNLELNGLSKIITGLPFGLGDRNMQVNFAFDPVNTGSSHITANTEGSQITSEIRTFDSFLPELNLKNDDRILFKLDVEGMEAEAIIGAADFVRKFSNILFILEVKHSGKQKVIDVLNSLALFEIGDIDEYNMYAKKLKNHPLKN
jgi:FkbM family methyltransferase